MSMDNNSIFGLDEGPTEVIVGLPAHVSTSGLSVAGVKLGGYAGVSGKLSHCGEPFSSADLSLDDHASMF